MKSQTMGWLMSYVLVLAAAVILTITAGMPGINDSVKNALKVHCFIKHIKRTGTRKPIKCLKWSVLDCHNLC